jgi:murein DD-endopeptidase MepM/ murein hydrolase activator NlpD
MDRLRLAWAQLQGLFPERRLYVRSGGEMRAYVLSPRRQMAAAGALGAAALWMGVCTAAMLLSVIQPARAPEAPRGVAAGDPTALTDAIEHRHAALALLLADAGRAPGAAKALTPSITTALQPAAGAADAGGRLRAVAAGQEQVIAAADGFARAQAAQLAAALRLAQVAPGQVTSSKAAPSGLFAGPLAADPNALAALLQVDPGFAKRLQTAASAVYRARALQAAAAALPLGAPTRAAAETSGYGVRKDPITRQAAFHPGLDFAGARMTPVLATAAGVVAFTGVRAGYGRTVEVDHGGGFRTRYAHLARIDVRRGEPVAAGARLGGMGSTGRSTGTHPHYEVWENGRAQNPARFVRAGAIMPHVG